MTQVKSSEIPFERIKLYNTNFYRRSTNPVVNMMNQASLDEVAKNPVRLVPIRLDLEVDGVKIRDSFTWNLNETLITPEQFGQILVDDIYENTPINGQAMVSQIANAIRQQCQAWVAASHEDEDLKVPTNQEENEQSKDDLGWRTLIRLDLQVGETHLTDQFEWPLVPQLTDLPPETIEDVPIPNDAKLIEDLSKVPDFPTPESFAKQLCSDLGMGGEFISIIAHSIREQLCYARLNFDEAPKVQSLPVPPVRDDDQEEFKPFVERLSEEEIEKRFKEQERTARRMRRSQRLTNTTTIVINRNESFATEDDSSRRRLANGRQQFANFVGARGPTMHPYMNYGYSSFSALPQQYGNYVTYGGGGYNFQRQQPKQIPYRNYRPSDEEQQEILKKLEETIKLSKLGPARTPPRTHRGFGASAHRFNADGSLQVGEFREKWRCSWCLLSGKFTPTLRKGPMGSKTLCNACGIWYGKHGSLPKDRYQEHADE